MTKSQLFAHVHAIVRCKNVAYFGGYQKAFAHYLREAHAQKLVYGFSMDPAGKAKTWYGA